MKKSSLRFLSFFLVLNLVLPQSSFALRGRQGPEVPDTVDTLKAGLEQREGFSLDRRQFLAAGAVSVLSGNFLVGQPAKIPDTLKPADPKASAQTKQLLNYIGMLKDRKEGRVLAGQFIGHPPEQKPNPKAGLTYMQGLYAQHMGPFGDKKLGIPLLGVDYERLAAESKPSDRAAVNAVLIEHAKKGGAVTITWHVRNPWTGGSIRKAKDQRVPDAAELLKPGTAANRAWIKQLDEVAAALQELQKAGVVVLWRPFHESNGKSFWYAQPQPPASVKALWQHQFNYFTNVKGLHNLIWVYAVLPKTKARTDLAAENFYYPGDKFVDMVGWDSYGPVLDLPGYEFWKKTGKPLMLAEFGPFRGGKEDPDKLKPHYEYVKLADELKRFPEIVVMQAWNGPWGFGGQKEPEGFLGHPTVVNLEQFLKDLGKKSGAEERKGVSRWITGTVAAIIGLVTAGAPEIQATQSRPDRILAGSLWAQQDSGAKEKAWLEKAKKWYGDTALPLPKGIFDRKSIVVVAEGEKADPDKGLYKDFYDALQAARKDDSIKLILLQKQFGGNAEREYMLPAGLAIVGMHAKGNAHKGVFVPKGNNLIAGINFTSEPKITEGVKGVVLLNNKLNKKPIPHVLPKEGEKPEPQSLFDQAFQGVGRAVVNGYTLTRDGQVAVLDESVVSGSLLGRFVPGSDRVVVALDQTWADPADLVPTGRVFTQIKQLAGLFPDGVQVNYLTSEKEFPGQAEFEFRTGNFQDGDVVFVEQDSVSDEAIWTLTGKRLTIIRISDEAVPGLTTGQQVLALVQEAMLQPNHAISVQGRLEDFRGQKAAVITAA